MTIRNPPTVTSVLAGEAGVSLYESFRLATWGDSLTQGIPGEREPWQTYLAAGDLGFRQIFNGGYAGQDSEEIRDRMLAATGKHSWSTTIWSGRNDKSEFGSWGQRTLDAIAAMVAALTAAGNARYLILGVTNNGGEYAAAGGAAADNYAAIVAINAQLATIYGARFWDVRSYLVNEGMAAVGATPTVDDLIDIGRDVIPTSLRVDATDVHMNSLGNEAIAIGMTPLIQAMHTDSGITMDAQAVMASLGESFASRKVITDVLYIGSEATVYDGKFLEVQPLQLNIYAGHFRGISDDFDPIFTDNNTIFGTGDQAVVPDMSGRGNSLFGSMTGTQLTSGSFNTVNGFVAGENLVDGQGHTYIGHLAGNAKVGGAGDVGVGRYALAQSTATAEAATAVGFQAGYNTLTGYGTFLGYRAGIANTTGIQSVVVGHDALFTNLTGSRYVAIGHEALKLATTTGKAVGVGFQIADNLTTGDGFFAGYLVDAQSATAAGQINIMNCLMGTGATGTGTTIETGARIGINIATPLATLHVGGGVATSAPAIKTADFSLTPTDKDFICNKAGSDCVATLGDPANHIGRELYFMNYSASFAVVCIASSIGQVNGTNTTAICPVGAGKWVRLKASSASWRIMAFGG
jgi:hypothetical protein